MIGFFPWLPQRQAWSAPSFRFTHPSCLTAKPTYCEPYTNFAFCAAVGVGLLFPHLS
ncbi:predicted protein [Plenodomus lingam JN3]|uniref:Predicted protein n=1 Tax=Leptosphaeria maculans (strain JN3 / isolate v23.1.3 / race Av1-4-5-6-7-8) TaxID=985895 RepID=E5A299_LEPMJ|nr:predicted protein [Plenodomus lingam JN3]CBX97534.1 predicted protein [Plenodomus lingam JN3]